MSYYEKGYHCPVILIVDSYSYILWFLVYFSYSDNNNVAHHPYSFTTVSFSFLAPPPIIIPSFILGN